jgi:hypothetical protein
MFVVFHIVCCLQVMANFFAFIFDDYCRLLHLCWTHVPGVAQLNSCGRCVVTSVELRISVKHPTKPSVSHYYSAPKITKTVSMGFSTCSMHVQYST